MAFNATLQIDNGTAMITLTGELDASVAQAFRDTIQQAAAQNASRLVLPTAGSGVHVQRGLARAGLR